MADNVIAQKSEDFAVRIVNLWKYLRQAHEHEMSFQIKKSGTSIGANVVEAQFAQAKRILLVK